jgi:hypothetical protein
MIYGHDKTIHRTKLLNVEIYKGKIVSVWYRCLALPFNVTEVDQSRAKEMQFMYEKQETNIDIEAIEIKRTKQSWIIQKPKSCTAYLFLTHETGDWGFTTIKDRATRWDEKAQAEEAKKQINLGDFWTITQETFEEK